MASKNGQGPDATQAAVAAAEAVETGQEQKRQKFYRCENGIVLGLRQVSPLLLRAASRNVKDPDVPQVYIEANDRTEANPMDPGYLQAMEDARIFRSDAALTVALLSGTFVADNGIPEGMYGPDDEGWIDDIKTTNEVAGTTIEVHDILGSKARYHDWLKLYALGSETEIFMLSKILTIGVVLTGEEVQRAAESFRRLLARGADLGSSDTEAAVEWDPVLP